MENLDATPETAPEVAPDAAPFIAPTFESTDEALDQFLTPPVEETPAAEVDPEPRVVPAIQAPAYTREVREGLIIETF